MTELIAMLAGTLASKGAELLASGAAGAARALVRLIGDRLGRDAADAETFEQALAHPEDQRRTDELAAAIARAMEQDPAFAQQVRDGWRAASTELTADRGAVINQVTGRVEKLVQARDIHGDISL